MNRLVLVGEAPGGRSGSTPGPALDVRGATGKRLALFARLEPTEYMELDRRNLFQTTDEGKKWDAQEAAMRAWRMTQTFEDDHRVVLLGSRVAEAFGLRGYPYFTWIAMNPEHPGGPAVAIIPHPSGLNRMYNDPIVYGQATEFLSGAVRGL